MRFLASGFRTPSHGVVLAASKSSTLNLCAEKIDGLGRKKSTRVVTHFDIPSLYYAGIGLCLHKPKLGHSDEKGCDDVTSMESDKQCTNKVFWPRQARPGRTRLTMTATMKVQEPTTVMPASKLGEYTVVQEIAEGTFGKVKSMYLIS